MATKAMAQDVIICDMCETSPVQMYCNSCATKLCNSCVTKHISADTEKDHHIIIFKKKNTKPILPICKIHKEKNCEMKCKQCDMPVCAKCISSGVHMKHNLIILLEISNSKKDTIKLKTKELEISTYPKYERAVNELEIQIQNLPQTYDKLISEISDQGEEWHREVDVIIKQSKQEVEKMKTDDLANLVKLLEEMKNLLSLLRQTIMENNDILQSADVIEVLESKYSSPEMWSPPPSIDVTPPTFTPLPIQREQFHQMFGTLTAASMPHPLSSFVKLVENKLATAVKQLQLLDSPKSPTSIYTGIEGQYCITCFIPDEVWVIGNGSQIKRFTITGSLQETITTTTGHSPNGLTVTRLGDLIYTDYQDRSINRVRNGKAEKIISLLQDWKPRAVSCTNSNDLLIAMEKLSKPGRVVRYSGSTEKQVIQYDDQGKPFFSSEIPFIANDNDKDMICVSDTGANKVVVVTQAGKLCFRYTGNLSSQKYKSFSPRGLVTDRMGHILIADRHNHCVHIIDQQGHLIHYIDNCQLSHPLGLSLDRNNTLYVAEYGTAQVKVIKYLT